MTCLSSIRWMPFALAALMLAGCHQEMRADRIAAGECVINIGTDPSSLDPSQIADIPAAKALNALTRGLTFLDDDAQPQPELADRWEVSPDGLVWTFHLRPAQWTNGQPVTADDFVYTWTRRTLNPAFGAAYAYQLFYIKGAEAYFNDPARGVESIGVSAPAPDVLRVELENPTPYFADLLAHHSFYPVCRSVDEANPNWYLRQESYVGCGPFRLVEYSRGSELVMEKNPDYWNAAAVRMQRLRLRMIEQESTERIAFENGELDGTLSVPNQDLAQLKGRPELRQTRQTAVYYVVMNTLKPPLDDLRVRRALALATPRQSIVEHVTRAGQRPALTFTPPELYGDRLPATTLRDADYEAARRLLAEAGYPGGKGFRPLTYLYNTMEGHRQIALVLQETWRRELGIEIQLENQEFKVTIERRRAGDFDIARDGWVGDFADPINFLAIFGSDSENNYPHWYDAHYDALLKQSRMEPDPERRLEILRTAESYLMDNAPVDPIYFYMQSYLVAPRLDGYLLNSLGMFDPVKLAWTAEGA